jgi:hypothetical protein
VDKRALGSANGIAHAASSFARITGPAVFGAVFGWTTTNGLPFPLDNSLVFILISLAAAGCLVISYTLLSPRINFSRQEWCELEVSLLNMEQEEVDEKGKTFRTRQRTESEHDTEILSGYEAGSP